MADRNKSLRRPIQMAEGLLQLLDFVLKLVFDYGLCLYYINGTNTTSNLPTSPFGIVLSGVSIVQVNSCHSRFSSAAFPYLFFRFLFPFSEYSVEIRWLHCESKPMFLLVSASSPYHCPPQAKWVKVDQESHNW